jgi:hypothetical protein
VASFAAWGVSRYYVPSVRAIILPIVGYTNQSR